MRPAASTSSAKKSAKIDPMRLLDERPPLPRRPRLGAAAPAWLAAIRAPRSRAPVARRCGAAVGWAPPARRLPPAPASPRCGRASAGARRAVDASVRGSCAPRLFGRGGGRRSARWMRLGRPALRRGTPRSTRRRLPRRGRLPWRRARAQPRRARRRLPGCGGEEAQRAQRHELHAQPRGLRLDAFAGRQFGVFDAERSVLALQQRLALERAADGRVQLEQRRAAA